MPDNTYNSRQTFWSVFAILMLGMLVFLIAKLAPGEITTENNAEPDFVIPIKNEAQQVMWTVAFNLEKEQVHVKPVSARVAEKDHSYQLWLFTGKHSETISLGIINATSEVYNDIPENADLDIATSISVSLEPAGGSKTGLPGGYVMFVSSIIF